MRSYTEIEHTADRAFQVCGHDLAELFTNAALALKAVQGAARDRDRACCK